MKNAVISTEWSFLRPKGVNSVSIAEHYRYSIFQKNGISENLIFT